MKTKEYKVKINRDDFLGRGISDALMTKEFAIENDYDDYDDATLILQIPEKKIEITEKQLDEAFRNVYGHENYRTLTSIKEELGF